MAPHDGSVRPVPSLAVACWLLPAVLSCGGGTAPPPAGPSVPPAPSSGVIFSDGAAAAGLDFVHFNGMSGEFYFCEMMGPGGAMLDYDDDGDLDIFIPQGTMLGPGKSFDQAIFPHSDPGTLTGRLYRNDLSDGTLRFTDVTEESGIVAAGYGMGVATGDIDNDGDVDLYLTNFGDNQMLRNNGDGTFTDVTDRSGANDPRWSVSASFLDYDRDGRLDLFVGNYVDYSFASHKECFSAFSKEPDYCSPLSYNPVPDRLFRNRGDGTFEDVTARSRIAGEYRGALGVVAADFDGDGRTDIYVANDQRANHLWFNLGDGTFQNRALLAGVALSGDGKPEASMGVDAGDFDADGDEDLYMTHLWKEANRLYVNGGRGLFEDGTGRAGLPLRQPYTGFGTFWIDFDNDGWLDLLVVNGAVTTIEERARAGDPFPLDQPKQLFRNLGNGRFEEITDRAGPALAVEEVSRGAAFGDIDNDGDTDVLVVNNNGPARLLINEVGNRHHWIGLRLAGSGSRKDMPGTRVRVRRTEGPDLWRRVHTDGSYASASDPRVLVGLGASAGVVSVVAVWPDGRTEEWTDLAADRWVTLREGTGRPTGPPEAGSR